MATGGNGVIRFGAALIAALACALLWAPAALATPPANDDFANAQALSGFPASASGTNVEATRQLGEPALRGAFRDTTVWYSWQAPSTGPVAITTCGSNFNTVLGVYTGSSLNALSLVSDNDNSSGPWCNGTEQSEHRVEATAGVTYHIVVAGFEEGEAGQVAINVIAANPPPGNDDFADAEVLSGLPAGTTGTTLGATKESGEPDHGERGGGHSVWYSWTAPGATAVTVNSCGTGSLHSLAVYTGSALGSLTRVPAYQPTSLLCAASFNASKGTTYRIAVDAENETAAPVNLAVEATPAPPHDDFDDPYVTNNHEPFIAEGTNAGATKEAGEPNHGGDPGGSSIWFTWVAPDSGVASISTCGSSFEAVFAAYEGDHLGDLRPLGRTLPGYLCEPSRELRFGVTAGQTYRFALDGSTQGGTQPAAVGEYLIRAHVGLGYPQNDEFKDAWLIGHPTSAGEWKTENVEATREAGEPLHAGRPGAASLWWGLSSNYEGPVTLNTCESDFDTLLGVYEGASLDRLRTVASNDDSAGPKCPGTKGSEVRFDAAAGTTYWIAVDGADGATGRFKLKWKQTVVIPPDTTPPNTRIRRVSFRRSHRVAEIKFSTSGGFAHLRCKLDRHHSQTCGSPQLYTDLPSGWHRLEIVAIDKAGNRDPTPAVVHFRIAPPPPKHLGRGAG